MPGGQDLHGPEEIKQLITTAFTGLHDFHVTIEDLIAKGDKVVARSTRTATHNGEWVGIAPTGKQVTWTYLTIYRIEEGKIVEEYGEGDYLGNCEC